MELIFWFVVGLLIYTYLGYPALMVLLAHLRPRPVRRGPIRPAVSFLIVTHNEGRWIERKLENCLAIEYPKDRLEIVVTSDGSTDGTAEIARWYEALGVTVIGFETRRGKAAVLNDVIPKMRGEIVVLSDARQLYERRALVELVENFADPSVGAVSGELFFTNEVGSSVGDGVGFYWRYEKFIRRHESHFDSIVGTTGAICAIRRELFEPIPADTLLDDVLIPMRIVRQGYRVVFEPEARAFDRVASSSKEEFTRKVRTIAGNLQLFARERWVWRIRRNRLWFQAISHKFLRIPGPVLLGAAFVANVSLAGSGVFYQITLVGQFLFYAAALGGFFFGKAPGIGRWLSVPYAFCLLNLTALVGVVRFLAGAQAVTWKKASELTAPRVHWGSERGDSVAWNTRTTSETWPRVRP